LYFVGVVIVVYDNTSFSFIGFGYHCIFLPKFVIYIYIYIFLECRFVVLLRRCGGCLMF
jgi:hypothetical protein